MTTTPRSGTLFRLALMRRKRLLISLALGLLAFESLIVAVAAAIPVDQLMATKPAPASLDAFAGSSGGVQLASIAGLLGAGLLHPFWIALQLSAVESLGAAVVAGDVEDGTMELIGVRPVSRMRLLAERVAALKVAAAVLCLVAVIPLVVGRWISNSVETAATVSGLFVAALAGYALVFCFIGVAVLASCAARRRAVVLGVVGATAAGAYAINFIAQAWESARFARWISPFNYYRPGDALVGSAFPWRDVLVLGAAGAVFMLIAALILRRRELV